MAANNIGELFVSLGFDVDDAKLKDFSSELKGVLNTALELAGVSLGLAGFKNLMEGASQTAAQFREMNKELGISADGMQRFALAANQVNPTTSVEQFRANYRNFAQGLLEAETYGGDRAGALSTLMGRPLQRGELPDSVLAAIHENMGNMQRQYPGAQGSAFISNLLEKGGIGASSRPFFDLNQEEIDVRTRELKITEETTDHLAALSKAAAGASQWIDRLGTDLADHSSGFFTDVLKGISGTAQAFHEGNGLHFLSDNITGSGIMDGLTRMMPDFMVNGAHHAAKMLNKPIERAEDIKSFFRSKGWTAQDADIILQGLSSESGLDPSIYGHGKEAKGMAQEAYGLAQWHPERQAKFKELYGHDIKSSNMQEQLDFVNWELTHSHAKAAMALMGATSDSDKFAAFKGGYEGAAGWKEQNNTFNIYSNADPKEVARQVEHILEKQHTNTAANFPGG